LFGQTVQFFLIEFSSFTLGLKTFQLLVISFVEGKYYFVF